MKLIHFSSRRGLGDCVFGVMVSWKDFYGISLFLFLWRLDIGVHSG